MNVQKENFSIDLKESIEKIKKKTSLKMELNEEEIKILLLSLLKEEDSCENKNS